MTGRLAVSASVTHAAVLPPAAGHEDMMRVLLWNRPTYSALGLGEADAFLWKPSRPGYLLPLPIGASEDDGSTDPFCAGHTFLPDGDLVVFGGLDLETTINDCELCMLVEEPEGEGEEPDCSIGNKFPYGHRYAYRLDTSVDPPVWDAAPLLGLRERWYPTAVTMQDGRIFVSGHRGQPGPGVDDCAPYPAWTDPYSTFPTPQVREYLDGETNLFEDATRHLQLDMQGCSVPVTYHHDDYPRLHLLANGYLMYSNDHDLDVPRTRLMNVREDEPVCPGMAIDRRWELADDPNFNRHGGSSVHFVVRDGPFFDPVDVVYAIGGVEGFGDAQCSSPPNPSTDLVEKMIDPRPAPASLWEDVPSLPYLGGAGIGRGSHNTVILLDGSMLVVGGAGYSPGTACDGTAARSAVRYFPPEVFRSIAPGSAADDWQVMAAQTHERKYHSVAWSLPDGRVVSAGGQTTGQDLYPLGKYSLEIYEPDFYFDVNRPVITDAPATMELGDDVFEYTLDASICLLRDVGRVVLIRNGSMTHGFDFHQRYVELKWSMDPLTSPPDVALDITPPELDGFTAQPGWYMLVVIDDEDVPSEGRWIQLLPSSS